MASSMNNVLDRRGQTSVKFVEKPEYYMHQLNGSLVMAGRMHIGRRALSLLVKLLLSLPSNMLNTH